MAEARQSDCTETSRPLLLDSDDDEFRPEVPSCPGSAAS